jgi:hypothetical protein
MLDNSGPSDNQAYQGSWRTFPEQFLERILILTENSLEIGVSAFNLLLGHGISFHLLGFG